jgi:hypothetical protein
LDVDILTVGNLDVGILTVGNLDVGILTVGNLDVGILTVGNLDVGIWAVGNLDVDKRLLHTNFRQILFTAVDYTDGRKPRKVHQIFRMENRPSRGRFYKTVSAENYG